MDSEQKTILITGASSGIGEATTRRPARDGHQMVVGARRVDRLTALTEELRADGATVATRLLDVTDLPSVEVFTQAALDRFGRIDVLVNNSGAMPLSPVADMRIDEWNRMIDLDLRGGLHGIAAVLPTMRRQGSGVVMKRSAGASHAHGGNRPQDRPGHRSEAARDGAQDGLVSRAFGHQSVFASRLHTIGVPEILGTSAGQGHMDLRPHRARVHGPRAGHTGRHLRLSELSA
ncbi:SDR family oxidoreductase [Streptomyces parvus]|uniref:SDR family NAD(P)-dependent oxidoreductase n=1 Tax=Streptomyces parvus TaxID=66428 RepID=A0A7K3RN92_9ACTN|nr:SDR family NAD(P)-dependent oxidoreductase [Streptomyces parvus]NEC16697.1 SDR family NAD(P)-dependent oxidoreductase [Streptomyces parvus]